jgi:hypothetical protein
VTTEQSTCVKRPRKSTVGRDWYEWVGKFPARGADAALVYAELEIIRVRVGDVQPAAVVEAARATTSAMHAIFEWDDAKAAEKQRLHTAQNLVHSIRVIPAGEETPRRVYTVVAVPQVNGEARRGYHHITAIKEPAQVAQVMNSALHDLRSFVVRYRELETRLPTVYTLVKKLVVVLEEALNKELKKNTKE